MGAASIPSQSEKVDVQSEINKQSKWEEGEASKSIVPDAVVVVQDIEKMPCPKSAIEATTFAFSETPLLLGMHCGQCNYFLILHQNKFHS